MTSPNKTLKFINDLEVIIGSDESFFERFKEDNKHSLGGEEKYFFLTKAFDSVVEYYREHNKFKPYMLLGV